MPSAYPLVSPPSPTQFPQFVVWDTRDDQSWLEDFANRGVAQGTLFDKNGEPKLAYYEVLARLQNFAEGGDEPCATSDGVGECVLEGME